MSTVQQAPTGIPPVGARGAGPSAAVTPIRVAAVVLLTAIVVGVVATPAFVSVDNLRSVLQDASLVGIVAVAMTPMVMSGNFVSLASQQGAVLASMAFVYLVGTGTNVALAILITLLLLAIVGGVQGVVVAMGLNPVITTLAFGVITFGVINTVNPNGATATVGDHAVSWGGSSVVGVPIHVVVFLVVTVAVTVLMAKTVVGRRASQAGANPAAARLMGTSIAAVTIAVFALASLGMAVAGILGGAQFGVAGTSDFAAITIGAVAAILVGGTSIGGGYGAPWRSAVGAIVISAIQGLMTLNGFSTGIRQLIEGLLVVGVIVLMETVRRNRKGGK